MVIVLNAYVANANNRQVLDKLKPVVCGEVKMLKKGSIFHCINTSCNEPIGVTTRDVSIGDVVSRSDLHFFKLKYDAKIIRCHKCKRRQEAHLLKFSNYSEPEGLNARQNERS